MRFSLVVWPLGFACLACGNSPQGLTPALAAGAPPASASVAPAVPRRSIHSVVVDEAHEQDPEYEGDCKRESPELEQRRIARFAQLKRVSFDLRRWVKNRATIYVGRVERVLEANALRGNNASGRRSTLTVRSIETLLGEPAPPASTYVFEEGRDKKLRRWQPLWVPRPRPRAGCFVLVARERRVPIAEIRDMAELEYAENLAHHDHFHDTSPDNMENLHGLDDPFLPLLRDIIAEETRPSTPAERRARYERWLVSGSVLHKGFAREALNKGSRTN